MSNGQIIGGVVGAVIGYVVTGFNPYGAIQGAALGAGIGGYLDPPKGPTVQGPRLNDLAVQTSTYGAFIPRTYGTIGIHGNLLWLENNKLKESARKEEQGGKGGGSTTTVETFSYSATFILALCQGPISGIRRVWCMDKLIYNAGSDDLETIIASNEAAEGWALYRGTDNQEPDPRYEADVGAGNASAFRGIAYLAFYDFQLADYSNTLQAAQFKVEIVTNAPDSIILALDETPQTNDDFGYTKVQSEIRSLYGINIIDDSQSKFETGGNASYREAAFSLGRLSYGEVKTISDILPSQTVTAVRSSDSRRWIQYRSDNPFINFAYIRSDDGLWLQMDNNISFAQDIIEYAKSETLLGGTTYQIIFTYNGAGGGGLDTAARCFASDTGAVSVITNSMTANASWNLCTAGDAPFEWQITGASPSSVKTCSIRIYNGSLTAPVSSFSFPLSSIWPIMTSGTTQVQAVACRIRNGKAYLFGKDRTDDSNYIYAAGSSSGLDFEYTINSANAPGQQISAVWPYNDDQGFALTTDRIVQWRRFAEGGEDLAYIIETEVSLSALLSPADVNTSLIDQEVAGYRVQGGSIRSALDPLQGAWPFDVIQSGYQIKCVPRGQASVATIDWEELGATDGDQSDNIHGQTREMDTQLPARTTIKYIDAVREYAASEQYAERINTDAVNRVDRELPIVLSANKAAEVAEVLQGLAWLERADFNLSIPPIYRALECADVITVNTPQATYQLRLTEINYAPGGVLDCKAKPNRAALYDSNATGGEGVPPIGTVPLPGPSIFLPLDIPVVNETIQNAVGFVGVMTGVTNGWPGAVLVRSNDGGQTWQDLQGYLGKASAGTAREILPASDCTLIDQRSITVELVSGALESVTRDQMLAGVNYAAYGVNGRWEIVRFQNATLQVDGSYIVSGFVRGERGTEWATGLHAVGDYFVLLDDPDNAFIGSPVESIALERLYRGVTSGASVDSAADVEFTYQGVNLEPLSPVYASGSRDVSDNLTVTWTRRSRLSNSWWTTGAVAPIGEASESYEVDIMNGSTVVRTITATTPTITYTAAQQTTDFGSPQATVDLRIYQLSDVVARGYALEATL